MTHPIGYYASSPRGTSDATILANLEEQIGSFSQYLNRTEQLAYLAVLAVYLLYRNIGVEGYKINDAVFDTLVFPEASIDSVIQQLEGISESNALALIIFFAAQVSGNISPQH